MSEPERWHCDYESDDMNRAGERWAFVRALSLLIDKEEA